MYLQEPRNLKSEINTCAIFYKLIIFAGQDWQNRLVLDVSISILHHYYYGFASPVQRQAQRKSHMNIYF